MIPEKYHTVSFIIPTKGRESLHATLASIEIWPGDEIITVSHVGPPLGWGGRERMEGIAKASRDYLSFMDDDDIYLPGHREMMHRASQENVKNHPIIFKMRYPSGRVIWDDPKLRCGNVGTPMIFVPNVKEMFPEWGDRRYADFNWLNSLGWEARKFIWRPEIICQLGKEDERWWRYQTGQPVYSSS